jgi:hypothetical protein
MILPVRGRKGRLGRLYKGRVGFPVLLVISAPSTDSHSAFSLLAILAPTATAPFLAIIPVPITVPVVVVVHPAPISFPVPFKVFPALITRSPPTSAGIGCPSPIASMPVPMVSHRIPIAIDPYIFGCGWKSVNHWRRWRRAVNHWRRWRRTDPDADGNLSAKGR